MRRGRKIKARTNGEPEERSRAKSRLEGGWEACENRGRKNSRGTCKIQQSVGTGISRKVRWTRKERKWKGERRKSERNGKRWNYRNNGILGKRRTARKRMRYEEGFAADGEDDQKLKNWRLWSKDRSSTFLIMFKLEQFFSDGLCPKILIPRRQRRPTHNCIF